MEILLILLSAQETESPEDLVRLLQEFRAVLDAERETTDSAVEQAGRATATIDAVTKLDRPSTRRILWQALTDADLTPETRILVIQALRRLGELSGFMETLAALTQFGIDGGSEDSTPRREDRKENAQTAVHPIPTSRPRTLAAPPLRAAPDDKAARRNTVLGISGLCVVALLLLLRKGR